MDEHGSSVARLRTQTGVAASNSKQGTTVKSRIVTPIFAVLTLLLSSAAWADGPHYTDWTSAVAVSDTGNSVAGGCASESPDGLSLYFASDRSGTLGYLDIWVAHRPSKDAAFGVAWNLGAPVNSASDDFCPTPLHGNWLLFISALRPGGCGLGDIYVIRNNPALGWGEPVNLGCAETGDGPNTAGAEFSPSLVETDQGTFLYFSSNLPTGDQDIYVSQKGSDGTFGPGSRVNELSMVGAADQQPNVSKDGREIVFSSNRAGGSGSFDLYYARRDGTDQPWSGPVNLGGNVNTAAGEFRPTISWDLSRLTFHRSGEIFVSERSKIRGKK